jgi:hypothetical protein
MTELEKAWESVEHLLSCGFYLEQEPPEKMTTLSMFRRGNYLIASSEDDLDRLKSLQEGKMLRVQIPNDRNMEFHKKYHALFKFAWCGLNEVQSGRFKDNITAFRHAVEMEAGSVEPIYDFHTDKIIFMHKSTAVDKLSQKDFEELYERVKDVLINLVFRKCKDQEFLDKLNEF